MGDNVKIVTLDFVVKGKTVFNTVLNFKGIPLAVADVVSRMFDKVVADLPGIVKNDPEQKAYAISCSLVRSDKADVKVALKDVSQQSTFAIEAYMIKWQGDMLREIAKL